MSGCSRYSLNGNSNRRPWSNPMRVLTDICLGYCKTMKTLNNLGTPNRFLLISSLDSSYIKSEGDLENVGYNSIFIVK